MRRFGACSANFFLLDPQFFILSFPTLFYQIFGVFLPPGSRYTSLLFWRARTTVVGLQECGLCHDIFMKECAVHIHVRQAASQLTVVFNGFYPSFCFEKVGHRSACLVFQEPVQLPAACSAITIFRF